MCLTSLHTRVIGGDLAALDAIAEDVLPRLRQALRRAFRRIADDTLQDAAEDAIMDYARCPQDFHPSSAESLDRCLYRAAWRNVANSLDSEVKRRRRESRYATETAREDATRRMSQFSDSIEGDLMRQILKLATNDGERTALACWLTGERRTEPLAQALGVGVLSIVEQRRTVKQFKDRILKRIRRRVRVGGHRSECPTTVSARTGKSHG